MLTEEQQRIVRSEDKHTLVVANAGTGKSHTIIERLHFLINEKRVDPSRILLTSFSRTAGGELYEKSLSKLGSFSASSMSIGTIHSICYKIVLQNIDLLNLKKITIVSDSYLTGMVLNRNPYMFEGKKDATKIVSSFRKYILQGGKLEISSDAFAAIDECQKILHSEGKYIYDDLMLKTVELFKNYPHVLKEWKGKFDYIFTDEAQDTNKIQWDILAHLESESTHTCVVGDAKQNIYAFRGSSFLFMDDFRKRTNATVLSLSETFRFGQPFADISNRVIDDLDIDPVYKKHTITKVPCSNKPSIHAMSLSDQVNYIADSIKEKVEQGFQYKDLNIVYRYNKESLDFMKKFIAEGIPFEVKSGDIFEKIELRLVLKSVGILEEFTLADCIDLFSMYNNFVGDKTLTSIYKEAPSTKSVLEFVEYATKTKLKGIGYIKKEMLNLMHSRLTGLSQYMNLCTTGKQKPDLYRIAQIMDMNDTKFMTKDSADSDNPSEDREDFLRFFNDLFQKSEFQNVLEWYTDATLNVFKSTEKDNNKVKMKTVHGCKGQSLPVVYLIANRICDKHFFKKEEDIANEKFVFYVALTRAEKYLDIFIANPSEFRFNCIFSDEWKAKYPFKEDTGFSSAEDNHHAVYELPDSVKSVLSRNYLINKKTYKQVLKQDYSISANTEKAVLFSFKTKQFWLPTSLVGFNKDRYYIPDWVVSKNKLSMYMESY